MRRPGPTVLVLTAVTTAAAVFLLGRWFLPMPTNLVTASGRIIASRFEAVFDNATSPSAGRGRLPDSPSFPEEEISESLLEEEMAKGNPCAALAWASQIAESQPGMIIGKFTSLIRATPGPLEKLGVALTKANPFEFAQDLALSEQSTYRFHSALAHSGLLFLGLRPAGEDWGRAFRLLEELQSAEPDNGAYSCYFAAAMRKQGASFASYAPWIQKCLDAPKYDDHSRSVPRAVLASAVTNPAARVLAEYILIQLPMVDQSPLGELVIEMLENERGDVAAEDAYRFGRILMDQNVLTAEGREDVDWSALEYSVGRKIARRAFELTNPGDPFPDVLETSHRDLASETERERSKQWRLAWEELTSSPKVTECRSGKLAKYMEWEKSRLTSRSK